MQFVPPTPEELTAIERIRVQLSAENVTHPFSNTAILRFLRGRKNDEAKATKGLVKHLEWRQQNNVDSITAESMPVELPKRKFLTEGRDKEGRPIASIISRHHNKDDRNIDEVRNYILYSLENIMKNTKPDEERMVILFDLSEFSLTCMDFEVVQLLITTMQYNYPQSLAYALIVNAPLLFTACWSVIKMWIDPVSKFRNLASTIFATSTVVVKSNCFFFPSSSIPIFILSLPTNSCQYGYLLQVRRA
jgi:uncharacterized protein YeeX (DUF496 family)